MMNKLHRAFTLIELLVVIAIIAILAAILFPVFAQAKLAAKSTASLSNVKQIALGALMYANDSDDTGVVCETWYASDPINGVQTTKSGYNFNSWRALVYPYLKNFDILTDPLKPTIFQDPSFVSATFANDLLYGNIGMNHMYMGPDYYNGTTFVPKGIALTSLNKPAQTVYFAEMYNAGVDSTGEWNSAPAYYWSGMVDAPMCWDTNLSGNDPNQVDGNIVCIWNWGAQSGWETIGLSVANGAQTSGVVDRTGSGTNIAWADGHAKKLSIGALAAGTTFAYGQNANDTHFTPDYKDKYLWGQN